MRCWRWRAWRSFAFVWWIDSRLGFDGPTSVRGNGRCFALNPMLTGHLHDKVADGCGPRGHDSESGLASLGPFICMACDRPRSPQGPSCCYVCVQSTQLCSLPQNTLTKSNTRRSRTPIATHSPPRVHLPSLLAKHTHIRTVRCRRPCNRILACHRRTI